LIGGNPIPIGFVPGNHPQGFPEFTSGLLGIALGIENLGNKKGAIIYYNSLFLFVVIPGGIEPPLPA